MTEAQRTLLLALANLSFSQLLTIQQKDAMRELVGRVEAEIHPEEDMTKILNALAFIDLKTGDEWKKPVVGSYETLKEAAQLIFPEITNWYLDGLYNCEVSNRFEVNDTLTLYARITLWTPS